MLVQSEEVNGNQVLLEEDNGIYHAMITDESGALVIEYKTFNKDTAAYFYERAANVLSIKSIEAN